MAKVLLITSDAPILTFDHEKNNNQIVLYFYNIDLMTIRFYCETLLSLPKTNDQIVYGEITKYFPPSCTKEG